MRRDPLRRVSAGGEKAGLWPSASLLYCCRNLSLAHHFVMARRSGELIFVGGSRSSFSFHFLRSENKYFPNDMSYDFFFFLFKHQLWQNPLSPAITRRLLLRWSKFPLGGVRWLGSNHRQNSAPAEVKASNPFWRERCGRGCLRAASAERLETPRTEREHGLGGLHPRLCFFLTKAARIHVGYEGGTLQLVLWALAEQSPCNCYLGGEGVSQDAQEAAILAERARTCNRLLLSTGASPE